MQITRPEVGQNVDGERAAWALAPAKVATVSTQRGPLMLTQQDQWQL